MRKQLSSSVNVRAELRLRVLRVLEKHPHFTQRQLASELNVSLGGVNFALKALIQRGSVKVSNFRKSGNKVGYLYVLTAKGFVEKTSLATTFLDRKLEEYEMLKEEIENLKGEVDSAGSGKEAKSL